MDNLQLAFFVFRSRSGSTLFGDRLGRHPEIVVAPETNALRNLVLYFEDKIVDKSKINYSEIIDFIYGEKKLQEWGISKQLLLKILNKYKPNTCWEIFYCLCRLYRDTFKKSAKIFVVKKDGWYSDNAKLFLKIYKNSKILWMIRDPRAIYNSASKAIYSRTGQPMDKNVFHNSFFWKKYINQMVLMRKESSNKMIEIYYEKFLSSPEETLSLCWKFLDTKKLNKNEISEIMKKHKSSQLITKSTQHLHKDVTNEIILDYMHKWKKQLPNWKINLINFICKKQMQETGYY
tara:strand:- start:319 stop:1188 length:870 start_codon:yes stop_codon:yes gene_type:complete